MALVGVEFGGVFSLILVPPTAKSLPGAALGFSTAFLANIPEDGETPLVKVEPCQSALDAPVPQRCTP